MNTPRDAFANYVFDFDKGVCVLPTPGGKQKGCSFSVSTLGKKQRVYVQP